MPYLLRSKSILLPLWLLILPAINSTRIFAQSVTEVPLYPSAVSAANVASPPEQVTYRLSSLDDHGFNRVIHDISVPTMTIYRPAQNLHRGVAVVICPGGGYRSVVIDREGAAFGRYFQQHGLTAVVLKYRLPQPLVSGDTLPVSQQDALAALKFVRAHAAEWGIDGRRIGLIGSSAGGHLAGSTAILGDAATGSRPDFVALLYPVICMEGPYIHRGSREKLLGLAPTAARVGEFSLEQRVRPGLPPFFLVHANDDQAVPVENSQLFAKALKQAGVPVALHLYAVGGHGFSLGRGTESLQWPTQFLAWLDSLP